MLGGVIRKKLIKWGNRGSIMIKGDVFYWIRQVGILLIVISLLLLGILFFPILREEYRYFFFEKKTDEKIRIIDGNAPTYEASTFSIPREGWYVVIPKIHAFAPIIPQVDPFNEKEYRIQLTKGVAHAKGSVLPGERGNVFLFAHSSDAFYRSSQYNTLFYLLDKLEAGDLLYIVKEGTVYTYRVEKREIVRPEQVEYLAEESDEQMVTLMTCWPAGTVAKRLLVQGTLIKTSDISEGGRDDY